MEKLVYGGDGLARLDGRVILTPLVLPGERVRVASEQEKPALVRARMLAVEEASPQRQTPECRYFGRCGGCQYQHASYAFEVVAKRDILVEELKRLGKLTPPETIGVVMGEPNGYRNRVQLRVADGRLGYVGMKSHAMCAIDDCPIASPKVNETIATLRRLARDPRWPKFIQTLEIFTDEESVQLNILETARPVARRFFDWCAEEVAGYVPGALDYSGRFRVSSSGFFQVNRFLFDDLVKVALDGIEGETALDLYAGVGLFSVALGRKFQQVVAVESGRAAVRDLEFNATRAGLTNVKPVQTSTEAHLAALEAAPDFMLLDPPRAGLGKEVVARLAALKPRLIVIVACDPSTLARDLAGLVAAGYKIEAMTMVDLFPRTYHLETVVRLTLSASE